MDQSGSLPVFLILRSLLPRSLVWPWLPIFACEVLFFDVLFHAFLWAVSHKRKNSAAPLATAT